MQRYSSYELHQQNVFTSSQSIWISKKEGNEVDDSEHDQKESKRYVFDRQEW